MPKFSPWVYPAMQTIFSKLGTESKILIGLAPIPKPNHTDSFDNREKIYNVAFSMLPIESLVIQVYYSRLW